MDSLALGTPIVAVAGTLYAHRVSASILAAAGATADGGVAARAPADRASAGLNFLVARNGDDLYAFLPRDNIS